MSTIALHSTLNISETVRGRGLVNTEDHQWEMDGIWSIKRSRDDDIRWRHVTPKSVVRKYGRLS